MKLRLILVIAFALLLTTVVIARFQDKTYSGVLMDVACGSKTPKNGDVSARAKGHTRNCALMASCVKSGYGVVVGDKFYKFDDAGNTKAKALLDASTKDKDLEVVVTGTMDGDKIKVSDIKEQ
ncbi:MAG TPA: hypothetical protein VFC63_11800 [Blastocatellia bacterium]|nr:hypothetical protein [Blastocatellia bacterium]